MKKILSLSALLFLLFSACKKEDATTINVDLDTEFDLKFENSASFDEGDFEFKATKIDEQRCPCLAICGWEGFVKLELSIVHQGIESKHEIVSANVGSSNELSKVVIGDHKIELLKVKPNVCDVTSDDDYIFTFLISED